MCLPHAKSLHSPVLSSQHRTHLTQATRCSAAQSLTSTVVAVLCVFFPIRSICSYSSFMYFLATSYTHRGQVAENSSVWGLFSEPGSEGHRFQSSRQTLNLTTDKKAAELLSNGEVLMRSKSAARRKRRSDENILNTL